MADKLVPAFTAATMRKWEHDFEALAPRPPNFSDLAALDQIVSLRARPTAYGLGLSFRTQSGFEPAMMLNPVVARALYLSLPILGQQGKWMTAQGGGVIPMIPRADWEER